MAIVVMEGVAGQFKAREDNEKGRFMVDEGSDMEGSPQRGLWTTYTTKNLENYGSLNMAV